MTKQYGLLVFAVISLALLNNCSSFAQSKTKNQSGKGVLDTKQLNSLKLFLENTSGIKAKDTMVIKYDFNGDPCWNALDKKDKSYIQRVISGYQSRIKEKANQRPGISIFQFREAGQAQSAFKTESVDIMIDNGYLRSLLFKQRITCGSSAIILPGGQFIVTKYDPHFDAINLRKLPKN